MKTLEQVEVPQWKQLVAGFQPPPWLKQSFEAKRRSPFGFEAIGAVGLAARFACRANLISRSTLQRVLLGEITPPRILARGWVQGLDRADLDELEVQTSEVIRSLADDLEEFPHNDLSPKSLCLRRDDIESVLWLLSQSRSTEKFVGTISDVDRRAVHAGIKSPDCPRLRAVRQQKPHAWWAQ